MFFFEKIAIKIKKNQKKLKKSPTRRVGAQRRLIRVHVDVYVEHIHQHRGAPLCLYVDVYVEHIHQHRGASGFESMLFKRILIKNCPPC